MTDSEINSPADAAPTPTDPAGTEYPNFIARSALGVVRRTERALSPWIQRLVRKQTIGPIQRQPRERGSPGAPLDLAKRAVSIGRAVQRPSSILRTALAADRFASRVVDRFPPVSAKYESKPLASPAAQRAELPVADGGAPSTQTENFTPMFPASAEPAFDDIPPINLAPGDSVASQLALRLQAFRQADSDAPIVQPRPGRGQPSPREISRKAAAVAQRRITAERPKLRRASVEEIGARPPEPMAAKEVESKPAPLTIAPEAIQREAAESKPETKPRPAAQSAPPTPQPSRPAAPVAAVSAPKRPADSAQRKPALPWDEGAPETIEPGPNPEKPSVFEALAQRLAENRFDTQWESPSAEPGETPPAPTRESRPLVQRKPAARAPRPAAAPEQPPAIIQRAEPEPQSVAEELPLTPQPVREPPPPIESTPESKPTEPAAHPAVQRQVEKLPASTPVEKSESETKAAVPVQAAVPRPVIRRTPEPAPRPVSQAPTESRVEGSSERPDDSERGRPRAEALSPPAAQPARPPAIRREAEVTPPRVETEVEPSLAPPPLSGSIRMRADAAVRLPLAQAPSAVQRRSVEARAAPPTLQTAEVVSREPAGEVDVEPVALPSSEPVEKSLPLARQLAPAAVQRLADTEKAERPQFQPALSELAMGVVQRTAESVTRPRPSPPSLPLAANVSRAPAAVQRAIDTGSVTATDESRGSEETVEEQRPAAAQDLHALARKIYPLLKRMLAIERERR